MAIAFHPSRNFSQANFGSSVDVLSDQGNMGEVQLAIRLLSCGLLLSIIHDEANMSSSFLSSCNPKIENFLSKYLLKLAEKMKKKQNELAI
jgi:hypothetical protein